VIVAWQYGQGPVTPAICAGTVSRVPQLWQWKWMTLGAGFMWGGVESSLTYRQDPPFQFSGQQRNGKNGF
jgi:hypothetical protein